MGNRDRQPMAANPDWNDFQHYGSFRNSSSSSSFYLCIGVCVCTSNSTSTRTYWRVRGWLSRWRTVVIRASLMRLSWQSITLFRIVLRPPRLATTSGFFRAKGAGSRGRHMTQSFSLPHCRWDDISAGFAVPVGLLLFALFFLVTHLPLRQTTILRK